MVGPKIEMLHSTYWWTKMVIYLILMHIPKLFSYVNPFSTQVKNGWLCVVGKWAQKVCVCVCVFHIFHICIWEKYLWISISMRIYIYIYMYTYTIFLFYKCAWKTLLHIWFSSLLHIVYNFYPFFTLSGPYLSSPFLHSPYLHRRCHS